MQEKLFSMLMDRDEITWQSLIYDLVRTGEMDPWDIDVSVLSQRYLQTVRQMQEANLSISGKVLLASAILLRMKSEKLLTEGIAGLDYLMFPPDDIDDEEFTKERQRILLDREPHLTIKNPQARKRKVSVDDLIAALEKALDVNERKLLRRAERDRIPDIKIPERKINISMLIRDIFTRIKGYFAKKSVVGFHELVPSTKKEDIIYTMLPVLHLATQEKIDLEQKEHFGQINITLHKEKQQEDL